MKILHLYYDLLNLYGEYGNVVVLKKHLEDQGINVTIERKTINEDFNFDDYDFIYCGSGNESNELFVLEDLLKRKESLIKAIDNFNPSLGLQFSTYAVPMIIGEIKRFKNDKTSIKISRSLRDVAYRALKAKEELERNSINDAKVQDIAKMLGEPTHIVSEALQSIMDPVSLFDTVYTDSDDNLMLLDQIKDNNFSEDKMVENSVLNSTIESLSSKERDILRLRYFIGKTQTEISSEIGISQAQVSRLEKNALKTLEKELR